MLHDSFRKIRSDSLDKGLNHIAEDLSFAAFTTLDTEHFFAGMRTQVDRLQICMTTPLEDRVALLSPLRRPINLLSSFIRVLRVTTFSADSTQKSLRGCVRGHRKRLLPHQETMPMKTMITRTRKHCARKPERCDFLQKSLVVVFVSKEQEGRQKRTLEHYP